IHFWHHLIQATPWPQGAMTLPQYQAHRGYHSAENQENTIDAFRAAREKGATMCECDVRLSKDGIPIVFHDVDLLRIKQRPEKVYELTANEIKELANAPRLEEILTDTQTPSLWNIEIKSPFINDSFFSAVIDVIKKVKAQNRVIISSFNPFAIYKISQLAPLIPRALLVSPEKNSDNLFFLRHMLLVPFLKIHMLNLDKSMICPETIQFWNKKKIPLAVWTLTDPNEAKHYLQHGVKSIIADPQIFDSF
nr:glycerophosphodiester phosphodiesterase [Pseudobdellovibrionaceae bacterium]